MESEKTSSEDSSKACGEGSGAKGSEEKSDGQGGNGSNNSNQQGANGADAAVSSWLASLLGSSNASKSNSSSATTEQIPPTKQPTVVVPERRSGSSIVEEEESVSKRRKTGEETGGEIDEGMNCGEKPGREEKGLISVLPSEAATVKEKMQEEALNEKEENDAAISVTAEELLLYDVIFCSEGIYKEDSFDALSTILQKKLKKNGKAYFAGKRLYFGCGGGTLYFKDFLEKKYNTKNEMKKFDINVARVIDNKQENIREILEITKLW